MENSYAKKPGDPEPWTCACGNLMWSRDQHQSCRNCLGLKHARQVVHSLGTCPDCAAFPSRCLCRRLVCMLSLLRPEPGLPSTAPGAAGKLEWGDSTLATPLAKASWGLQQDLIEAQEVELMEMDYEEDEAHSNPVTFKEDDEKVFVSKARAKQPPATVTVSPAGEDSSTPPAPPSSSVMLEMCKCTAAQLGIP